MFLIKKLSNLLNVGVFRSSIMKSLFTPFYLKQFPLSFRLFFNFYKIYYRITGFEKLYGVKILYSIALFSTKSLDVRFETRGGVVIFLNLADQRFVKVVSEVLLMNDSDTNLLNKVLSKGGTFIDVGANHGSFSVIASSIVGKKGLVLSFEPQPELFALMKKSLEENDLSNFRCFNLALGDSSNLEVDFYIPKGHSGYASIYENYGSEKQLKKIRVSLNKLDDFLSDEILDSKNDNVLIKVDVEGSELAFIKGAKDFIYKYNPTLIMEVNRKSIISSENTGDDFVNVLKENHYYEYCYPENLDQKFKVEDIFRINKEGNILLFRY